MKETITKELNPKWVEHTAHTYEGSSQSTATGTDGTVKIDLQPDLLAPPQYIYVTRYLPEDNVDLNSPSLDKADRARTVPYTMLNMQYINMFARLLDRSLHHLLFSLKLLSLMVQLQLPSRTSSNIFTALSG
jgi:hypothetical protein